MMTDETKEYLQGYLVRQREEADRYRAQYDGTSVHAIECVLEGVEAALCISNKEEVEATPDMLMSLVFDLERKVHLMVMEYRDLDFRDIVEDRGKTMEEVYHLVQARHELAEYLIPSLRGVCERLLLW